jgi:hypothetical protein
LLTHSDLFCPSQFLPITQEPAVLNGAIAACLLFPLLLPLREKPHNPTSLIDRWRQIFPVDLATLQPVAEAEAIASIRQILIEQERLGFLRIEIS